MEEYQAAFSPISSIAKSAASSIAAPMVMKPDSKCKKNKH